MQDLCFYLKKSFTTGISQIKKSDKRSDKSFKMVMKRCFPIGLHGQLLKQRPMRGTVITGQREGEVLRARRYWEVSPPRNAAYNRRPDWPQHQHTTDSHSLLQHSRHFHTPTYGCRWDRHKHTADNGSPQARLGGVKVMSGTHCKRGVRQSRQNSQLLRHSTSEPGCSGRWNSETHSGNMWMQLHGGWWKARDYGEDKRQRVSIALFSVSFFSCL